MNVFLNGSPAELPTGAAVTDALDVLGVPRTGVAVAVDGSVVRRADWAGTPLTEGARVEVLTAVQGG